MGFLGVYMHIPFCVRKCLYCDFVSYTGRDAQERWRYVKALRQELVWYLRSGRIATYQPVTLYVGGGTPSLLVSELAWFFETPPDGFDLASFHEATIEVNPATVNVEQLRALKRLGFHRLSIGVQSFHDEELRILGRIHSAAEAISCVHDARTAGFENISLDLIFGVPGSTPDSWNASLQEAIQLKPEHISAYNLTLEPGTPFWQQEQDGRVRLPSEDDQLAMFQVGIAMLADAGFEHYEISNFARPGCRCQHNQIYWRNAEYIGLGVSAHSYLAGCRYWNTTSVETYLKRSQEQELCEENWLVQYPATVEGFECLDQAATIGETIMMSLRLCEGLDRSAFQERFGGAIEALYPEVIEKFTALGLLELTATHLRLTRQGLPLANEVSQEFLNV